MTPAWVRQEDKEGCGLAVLAMLTGQSYADVKAEVGSLEAQPMEGRPIPDERDWSKQGCTHYLLDRYLAGHGFFLQRRYDTYTELPMEPFAPLHYASVVQLSSNHHFVAVLANGDVLDPMREGVFKLSDWSKVNQLVGVHDPEALMLALFLIRENDRGESWSAGVAMSALASIEEMSP